MGHEGLTQAYHQCYTIRILPYSQVFYLDVPYLSKVDHISTTTTIPSSCYQPTTINRTSSPTCLRRSLTYLPRLAPSASALAPSRSHDGSNLPAKARLRPPRCRGLDVPEFEPRNPTGFGTRPKRLDDSWILSLPSLQTGEDTIATKELYV